LFVDDETMTVVSVPDAILEERSVEQG